MPYYPLGYGAVYGLPASSSRGYYRKTCWESDSKEIKECSLVKNIKVKVKIPLNLYLKFLTLVQEIKTEWLLYLTYDKEEKGNQIIYTVKDYVIPDQEVTSTSVKVLDPPAGSYGVIHAHQFTSSKFFSNTDEEYVNSNNVFSLVINGSGEIIGKSRLNLPCGNFLLKDCEIEILLSEEEKDENIVSEVKKHLQSPSYSYTYSSDKTRYTLKPVKDCPYDDIECYYYRQGKCTYSGEVDCPYHLSGITPKDAEKIREEIEEDFDFEYFSFGEVSDYCPFALERCPFYTKGLCTYPCSTCYAIETGLLKECPFNNDECDGYVYTYCIIYENPEVECDEFGGGDLQVKEDGGSPTSKDLWETRNSEHDSRGRVSSLHIEEESGSSSKTDQGSKETGE